MARGKSKVKLDAAAREPSKDLPKARAGKNQKAGFDITFDPEIVIPKPAVSTPVIQIRDVSVAPVPKVTQKAVVNKVKKTPKLDAELVALFEDWDSWEKEHAKKIKQEKKNKIAKKNAPPTSTVEQAPPSVVPEQRASKIIDLSSNNSTFDESKQKKVNVHPEAVTENVANDKAEPKLRKWATKRADSSVPIRADYKTFVQQRSEERKLVGQDYHDTGLDDENFSDEIHHDDTELSDENGHEFIHDE